jgi:DNA topoisomerase I
LVDDFKEKIGGYLIEAPTLFKGRGDHPKAGLMKARIMPEDISINVAINAPVPKCEMPGHAWKNIVHNNEVHFILFLLKKSSFNTILND